MKIYITTSVVPRPRTPLAGEEDKLVKTTLFKREVETLTLDEGEWVYFLLDGIAYEISNKQCAIEFK